MLTHKTSSFFVTGKLRQAMILAWCAVALSAISTAQERQQSVFRGRADLVPVRVTVTDSSGNAVLGLAASDFAVTEDGVQRDIVTFAAESFVVQNSASKENTTISSPAPSAPVRFFLIVLGDGRIQGPARGLDGARDFIQRQLLPSDQIAILAFNRATAFTADHSKILAVLERFRTSHESIVFDAAEWFYRRYGTELPPSIQRRIDDVFIGAEPRGAVELLLGMDGHQAVVEPTWNQPTSLISVLDRAAKAKRSLSDILISSRASPELKLLASIEYLRRRDGIKHVIWVGNGLRLTSVEDDKRLTSRATDAGVTLNVIYTSGVAARPAEFTGSWDISAAQRLARETGGFSTAVSYADQAFSRIAEQNRGSYLLGYSPVNPVFDGNYRNVRVSVKKAGLAVSHSKGYYARDRLPPPDLVDLVRDVNLKAGAQAPEEANDLLFTVKASPDNQGRGNDRQILIQLEVPETSLGLRADGNRLVGELDVYFLCLDSGRKVVGEMRQRIGINIDISGNSSTKKEGVKHTVRVPVSGPASHVKAVVYDYHGDRLGSRLVYIR